MTSHPELPVMTSQLVSRQFVTSHHAPPIMTPQSMSRQFVTSQFVSRQLWFPSL